MKWLEIVERIIGHIAWPLASYLIVIQFRSEIRSFIKRIKNAKYKDLQVDLEKEIKEIKDEAEDAGINITYDSSAFSEDSIKNIQAAPEWAFIKSWQDIEDTLLKYYTTVSGLKTKRVSVGKVLIYLENKGILDDEIIMLIRKLMSVRNQIVHNSVSSVTRGEAIEWLGISKSVNDKISQKLLP